jgi:hypothetical protein
VIHGRTWLRFDHLEKGRDNLTHKAWIAYLRHEIYTAETCVVYVRDGHVIPDNCLMVRRS